MTCAGNVPGWCEIAGALCSPRNSVGAPTATHSTAPASPPAPAVVVPSQESSLEPVSAECRAAGWQHQIGSQKSLPQFLLSSPHQLGESHLTPLKTHCTSKGRSPNQNKQATQTGSVSARVLSAALKMQKLIKAGYLGCEVLEQTNKMHITGISVCKEFSLYSKSTRVPNSDLRDKLSAGGQLQRPSVFTDGYHGKWHLHSAHSEYVRSEVSDTKHFPSSWNWELSLDFLL